MFDVSGVLLQPAFQNSVLGAIQDKLKIEDPEEMDAVGRAFKASLLKVFKTDVWNLLSHVIICIQKVQKEGVNLDKARSARKKLDEEDDDFK